MSEEQKSSIISDGVIDDFIEYDADRLLEEYSIDDETLTGKLNTNQQDEIPLKQKRLLTLSNCVGMFLTQDTSAAYAQGN